MTMTIRREIKGDCGWALYGEDGKLVARTPSQRAAKILRDVAVAFADDSRSPRPCGARSRR
jgi:hypothetical protein